jgi:hypothetical protein
MILGAGRLNSRPEIVLLHPVAVNGVRNGFYQVTPAVTKTANNITGCLGQIRLFARGLHILFVKN